jgi:hypothetical protein
MFTEPANESLCVSHTAANYKTKEPLIELFLASGNVPRNEQKIGVDTMLISPELNSHPDKNCWAKSDRTQLISSIMGYCFPLHVEMYKFHYTGSE